MIRLVGTGYTQQVDVRRGATLAEILAAANLVYDPTSVYRELGAGPLTEHDVVEAEGVTIFVGKAEQNGMPGL